MSTTQVIRDAETLERLGKIRNAEDFSLYGHRTQFIIYKKLRSNHFGHVTRRSNTIYLLQSSNRGHSSFLVHFFLDSKNSRLPS